MEFPPKGGNEDWEAVKLSELNEDKRREWNLTTLDLHDTFPLFQLCLGNYRLHKAQDYITHATQHELMQKQDEFDSAEAFFEVENYSCSKKNLL